MMIVSGLTEGNSVAVLSGENYVDGTIVFWIGLGQEGRRKAQLRLGGLYHYLRWVEASWAE